MSFTTADIKNISIIGHGGTGKTTLTEHVLFYGGVIPKPETVDSGKSVSDYTDEEIERKTSVHAALAPLEWSNKQLNFIDTPGIADFVGEVVCAMRATESALVIIDAQAGVQIETIKLWRRLEEQNKPRIIFINKMDKERASYKEALDDLKEKFDETFVPVTIPIGDGLDFKGIINLIEKNAYMIPTPGDMEKAEDAPADSQNLIDEHLLSLIESAAEGNDELLEKYFEESTLTSDEIRHGLQAGLQNNKIVPVLCGSGEQNVGLDSLLSFISNNAPSPEVYSETAVKDDNTEIEVPITSEGQAGCFVFKTAIDQFSGKLSFIKIVTGTLSPDSDLNNINQKQKERHSKVYRVLGKKLIEVKELCAGDIGVLTKLDSVNTNHTLGLSDLDYTYKPLDLPQPVFAVAVSADSKKSEDKLNESLNRAACEDLTFKVAFNSETKENVISGMGELHINLVLDKIKEKQKIEVQTKIPKIAYRETITKSASSEYTHKKQSGGHGQYGKVLMDLKPLSRGEFFQFENAIKGGSISKGYMPGIEKGILEAMSEGYLAGYPIVDLSATIVDGKEHPVDSSEMAFKLAGKGALKASLAKAGAVLLEPIMKLRVLAEEQYLGDILSDLSAKRGKVLGQENIGGGIVQIEAEVPQAEMLRYAIDLRSITSGTGSFELEFDHYSEITGKIAEAVIQEAKAIQENKE